MNPIDPIRNFLAEAFLGAALFATFVWHNFKTKREIKEVADDIERELRYSSRVRPVMLGVRRKSVASQRRWRKAKWRDRNGGPYR